MAQRPAPDALLRVAVTGAGGRMGQALIAAALATPGICLVAATDITGSAAIGNDAAAALGRTSGVTIASDIDTALGSADVLIDFTRPVGTLAHLAACARYHVAAVIGTTGFDAAGAAAIAAHAASIPIVFAPNMSVGVNVLIGLVERAAAQLGPDFDIEVLEMHHRHKIDAPSGTALRLGEAAAKGAGVALAERAVYVRE
ncbi:MAG: 4-hydroxy-tetrahydrodipicolinate reductase, partial [Casimicrobiaceae bacterium]